MVEMNQGLTAYTNLQDMILTMGAESKNKNSLELIEEISGDWFMKADFLQNLVNLATPKQNQQSQEMNLGFGSLAALTKSTTQPPKDKG